LRNIQYFREKKIFKPRRPEATTNNIELYFLLTIKRIFSKVKARAKNIKPKKKRKEGEKSRYCALKFYLLLKWKYQNRSFKHV